MFIVRPALRAIAAAVVAVLAIAAPASASDYTYHENYVYYWGINGDGMIQCAHLDTWYNSVDWGSYGEARAQAVTTAKRDLYCANNFNLPGGWIGAHAIVQRQSDGAYVRDTGMLYTCCTTYFRDTGVTPSWFASSGSYRGVTAHRVLIVGGWQDALKASSYHAIT